MHRLRQALLQAALQTDLLVQLPLGRRLPLLHCHPGLQQSALQAGASAIQRLLTRLLHRALHLRVTILTRWPALSHQGQLALQPAFLPQEALLKL